MDILPSVIRRMTRDEVRFFKLFSGRSHDRADRLDKRLFDLIRQAGEEYDDDKAFERLYEEGNKNAYYRLKNRLLQDVGKSLTLQHFDDDDTVHALHLLGLAKFHLGRSNTRAAHYYLRRAESEAVKLNQYELLDLIYGDLIRLSHEQVSVNPEEYIKRRRENLERIHQVRAIDDLLAAVSYRMRVTQNFGSGKNPVMPLLEKIVNEYAHDPALLRNPQVRFRLYEAVTRILLQKRDYPALEEYLLGTWKEFNETKLFNRGNHDAKLQMLVFIVNTLFKNGKSKESLHYAAILHTAMEEHQKFLYGKYLFFHYNALVINYSKLDKDKAIAILQEMKANERIRSTPFYEMFVYLNLAVLYFDKAEFGQSIRQLSRLYLLDAYRDADRSLQFKIAIAELMIRYELQDEELLERKLREAKKDFRDLITKRQHPREVKMLHILQRMLESENLHKDKVLQKQIQELLAPTPETEDAEILQYGNWLKSKLG